MWARYYRGGAEVTLANVDPAFVDLMPSLTACPPGEDTR